MDERMWWARQSDRWRRFQASPPREKVKKIAGLFLLVHRRTLAAAVHLLLRILFLGRPVRIGTLNAKGRITITVMYIEPYVRLLNRGNSRRPIVIVINPGATPNEFLARMYRRSICLVDDSRPRLRRLLGMVHRILAEADSGCVASLGHASNASHARVWQEGVPVLAFRDEDHKNGRDLLDRLGIPVGAEHVCFGLRDAAYYSQFLPTEAQSRHPNPEAGPDTYIRNPSLHNYLPMASRLADQGFFVLRMGQKISQALPEGLRPQIVDYASKHRTEFGDIYLLGTCKFVVTGAAGLWTVATAFNRPVVSADHYFLALRGLREGDLFIPVTYWFISEKRLLTFREMLAAGMRYTTESNCKRDGVELVHSSAEDITAVVDEMVQRLGRTWASREEDEELQKRFKALYTPEHMGYNMPGRVGAAFLRQHRDLLD